MNANPQPWRLWFDGLCEPNPGGVMACGWLLVTGDGEEFPGRRPFQAKPENTNNVAEYLALYYGLLEAGRCLAQAPSPFPGLVVAGDSMLVCRQIAMEWRVKNERLRVAHGKCLDLLRGGLSPYLVEWVPREQNELADRLSREAYRELTGREAPERRKAG